MTCSYTRADPPHRRYHHHPPRRRQGGSSRDTQTLPHPPAPFLSQRGREEGDRPGLRSDFAGRKGEGSGALDKSAAVALFHPVSPSNPAPGLRGQRSQRWSFFLATKATRPGLILLPLCSETMRASFEGGREFDEGPLKGGGNEQKTCLT